MANPRNRLDDPRTIPPETLVNPNPIIPPDPMIDPTDTRPPQYRDVRERAGSGSGIVFLAILVLLVLGGFWLYYGDTRPTTEVAQNNPPEVTQPAQPAQPEQPVQPAPEQPPPAGGNTNQP